MVSPGYLIHLFYPTSPTQYLLYADDLIILSRSKTGLQNCLNALGQYCKSWMLNINPKKTKIIVFQQRTKRYDWNFYIGEEKIDILHLPSEGLEFSHLEISRCHLITLKKRLFMLYLVLDDTLT